MIKSRGQSTTNCPMMFLMVLTSDHITGATGLSPTVTISKNGAAFGSPSGAVSEVGNGWYALAGNATDRGTLGEFKIHATAATADVCDESYEIVPYDPFAVTLPTDVQTIKTQAVTCAAGVTINANVGQTQPFNFTGTGASAYVKVDVQGWGGAALPAIGTSTLTTTDLESVRLDSKAGWGGSALPTITTPPSANDVATAILTDPTHKLATNEDGSVNASVNFSSQDIIFRDLNAVTAPTVMDSMAIGYALDACHVSQSPDGSQLLIHDPIGNVIRTLPITKDPTTRKPIARG